MNISLRSFAKNHNVIYNLSKSCYLNLLCSQCCFCQRMTQSTRRTYQNVGLYKWKRGFVDSNVFPLCKLCYIIRNGQTLATLMYSIKCILFRRPVLQKMKYVQKNSHGRCAYCYTSSNLSKNRIDSSKNYTQDNVQTLCWTCNRMKSNLKETVFFSHLHRLCRIHSSLVFNSVTI